MRTTILGRSEIVIPQVVLGSMAIGALRHDAKRHIETLHAAIDAGITAIDTAPLYDLGVCQERVGRVLAQRSEPVQVFSKVGLRWTESHGTPMFETVDQRGRRVIVRHDSRPSAVRRDVEESLTRLGVERIDLMHVHKRDHSTPIAETMGALADLMRQGKIGGIGLSTDFEPEQVREAQRGLGDVPLASVFVGYNPVDRSAEKHLLPLAQRQSIGVLAHTCLGCGLLTGKLPIDARTQFVEGDMRLRDFHFHPHNLRAVLDVLQRVVAPIGAAHALTVSQTILAWVLSRPTINAVVVGASTPEQARDNAQLGGVTLSEVECRDIGRAFARLRLDPYAGCSFKERVLARWNQFPRKAARILPRVARALHFAH